MEAKLPGVGEVSTPPLTVAVPTLPEGVSLPPAVSLPPLDVPLANAAAYVGGYAGPAGAFDVRVGNPLTIVTREGTATLQPWGGDIFRTTHPVFRQFSLMFERTRGIVTGASWGPSSYLKQGASGPLAAANPGLAQSVVVGTSIEAGALHFRGAFQNPFMYAPVTIPPIAAATLATATVTRSPKARQAAGRLLGLTTFLGVAGVGFHAWGVQRRMGGWSNWRQNVLAGPPLPAPPAFTGLALAGLAALALLDAERAE